MNKIKGIYENNRMKAGLVLLIAVTLYANVTLLSTHIKLYPGIPEKDPVTLLEIRMNKVKGSLPSSGSVGYVTVVENDKIFLNERSFYDVELLAQYVLTQYTLAPVLVYNSADFPIVIGNFIDALPDYEYLKKEKLIPVKDFGEGLVLYNNENKK